MHVIRMRSGKLPGRSGFCLAMKHGRGYLWLKVQNQASFGRWESWRYVTGVRTYMPPIFLRTSRQTRLLVESAVPSEALNLTKEKDLNPTARFNMQTLIRSMTASAALLVLLTNLCSQAQQIEQRIYRLGETILLSGSTGPGSDYQWFKDATQLTNTGRISGTRTPVLAIAASVYDDAGLYFLLNTNILLTNGVAALVEVRTNALYEVVIQDFPQIQHFFLETRGNDITFEVEATGGGLEYQWFWQDQPIPGATNSVLEYKNAYSTANAGYYHVEVSNKIGTSWSPPPGLLFLKPVPRGKYQGIFFDEAAPDVPSSGRFEFNLTSSKKAFSGKATILDQVYKFSGMFSDAHDTVVTATSKKGGTPLTLKMQLLTTNQTVFVEGTASDGTWISQLRGYYSSFNSNTPPAGFGPYTLALMYTNLSAPGALPNGVSIGTADMRMSGRVNTSGRMADGTPYSCSSTVSPTGEWPVYIPLYGNRGCLVGWVQTESTTNTGSTDSLPMFWIKRPGQDKYYPNGFNLSLQPVVSSYVRGEAALPLEESVASFAYGDLFQPDLAVWSFIKVSQPQPNRLVPEKSNENLQLTVSGGTGLISGKFTDFTTGLRTPIRAVVLQNHSGALGYFLSTNSSGYFSLGANAPGN